MSKTASINMRVDDSQRALLTKAADALSMDRTAFILNVACKEAQDVLLDQRLFQLDEKGFQAFEAALDAPVETSRLEALLKRPSPWEH
ncbi:DUF1778 domain-containing protein [Hydrogenovibrio marinus]|uniref:Toxin-antitoxin system protein n=1 Tax=Hydrogenovibrio marinus TaxID=28885 RepID=A0A066ZWC3_HYDMR|nr:DUF1778 domain-containing protein [Hydrogenovibrio marinus]KDN96579.1 hypothetical protein EI16_10005 [Hydrogenovibrio marinus]BBN60213.1 hypothetical protein HVMH_1807 [Hydrogenovibrio marinus]